MKGFFHYHFSVWLLLFVSPYFFNLLVRAFNRCYGKREVEIREGETQYFKLPHPLRPSRIDLGWYGRVL